MKSRVGRVGGFDSEKSPIIVLDSCGHAPMWDRPEKTVEFILENSRSFRLD
ncbi:MAG: hypothetical protein F2786_03070 [Actinobacteria bacterium]|nr:hypothetical protein [Actinomycetota bacterium]